MYFPVFVNYSTAANTCRNQHASLAHILTDYRTNSLADYLTHQYNNTKLEIAYVGLNQSGTDKFYTSSMECIECFFYRAWAPRYPRYF